MHLFEKMVLLGFKEFHEYFMVMTNRRYYSVQLTKIIILVIILLLFMSNHNSYFIVTFILFVENLAPPKQISLNI